MIVYIESLEQGRKVLTDHRNILDISISNLSGIINYSGVNIVDCMFKILIQEFSNISKAIINVEDNNMAFFTALRLGYKDIIYTGHSKKIIQMIESIK